jgi:hypothetical protein
MEKASKVSALAEASSIMRDIALPERGGKYAMRKIKNKLPIWSWRRVKSIFYAEPGTRVDADELAELKQLNRAAKLAQEDQESKDEIRTICERLDAIERLLLAQDKEFNSAALESIRASADRLRRLDGGQG